MRSGWKAPKIIVWCACLGLVMTGRAQEYGRPDRESPGDAMIQAYLAARAARVHGGFAEDIRSPAHWKAVREQFKEEYFHMLGLWPLPPRTPLHATVTGTLDRGDYAVDMLHFQSRPGLYVTGNLYRPAGTPGAARHPAVLYVCGHSNRGRNGNKTAYQSHGIWFARHGYVCLMLDTLQLGEIGAVHHGTYREGRWWWHSRGYTPAGVECWNGIRAIDYLRGRPDVDPERIAVTGISGGGAATFWIAAADERVHVAVPVSGMADLPSYVGHRVINGHCDCMFLYNTFQWPWVRIAALIAPRPLLFVNSDADAIFPMDANERVINRLERVYSLFGAGDRVAAMVSIGGHAYREDLRRGIYRYINTHLRGDPSPVTDSEEDLVEGRGANLVHPIDPVALRVFPSDNDIPSDQRNTMIDREFVPMARPAPPQPGAFDAWKAALVAELQRVTFRALPVSAAAAVLQEGDAGGDQILESEPGIRVTLRRRLESGEAPRRVVLAVGDGQTRAWASFFAPGDVWYTLEPRGTGDTRWTRKNPPNYVERSHVLVGLTADTGRVADVLAVCAYLRAAHPGVPVHVAGDGAHGVLAAYACLWDDGIAGATIVGPPASHMEPDAPQFLNVLRVCDVPDALGMIAPRPLTLVSAGEPVAAHVRTIYAAAGAENALAVK